MRSRRTAKRSAARRCLAFASAIVLLLALGALRSALPAEGGDESPPPEFDAPVAPQQLRFPTILIRRDPFASDIGGAAGGAPLGGDDGADIVLPPNAAAVAPVVRAVILGAAPKALIEVAGRPIVVGIGTPLANSVIAGISESGILLRDGESLRLTERRP
ncbi:MAG: hypothetical protein ABI231_08480 [Candidatus Tumulicola sp.]